MLNKAIVFQEEDLSLFAAASGDMNPLHLDKEYARKTVYGEVVVYGILGVLTCLAEACNQDIPVIDELKVAFLKPIYCGRKYETKMQAIDRKLRISLCE